MKKTFLALSLMSVSALAFGQKYLTRTGKIVFNATAPSSPEKIDGVNNEVATILDAKNGEVRMSALIKSFKFERELMQEHFNEEYMESDKYPKTDFSGIITNLAEINFSKDGEYKAKVSGKLQIHGISHEVSEPGVIIVKGDKITLKSEFNIKLADYKVLIGSMVADKINKAATIKLTSELTQK